MRRIAIGILSATVVATVMGVLAAPSLGMSPTTTAVGTVPGRYDAVANCLMLHLPAGLKGWPSVSPPPSRDAIVNVYNRDRASVTPVAVFHVLGIDNGRVAVSIEKATNVAMARRVVERCD
ncbi:MAG: hypothetical protein AB7O88_25675 [Reyranellaceae bacterium]